MVVKYENVIEVGEDDAENFTITTLNIKGKKIYKEEDIRRV